MAQAALSGSCLCGSILYEVNQIEAAISHCHCSMCRKFHGAAFATYGEAKVEDFRWLSGEALLSSFCGHNGTLRKFCSVCGSSLIFISAQDDGQVIEFALSTLDTELGSKPSAHIYTEFKANWYDMVDDLPQFKNGR